MAIGVKVKHYLETKGVTCRCLPHERTNTLLEAANAVGLSESQVARAVILCSDTERMMVVLPLSTVVDLEKVAQLTGRQWSAATHDQLQQVLHGTEPGCLPPLPCVYELTALVDQKLLQLEEVAFEAGCRTTFACVSQIDFKTLMANARWVDIAIELAGGQSACPNGQEDMWQQIDLPSGAEVHKKLQQLYRLPAIPAVAVKILQVARDADSSARDLSALVEMDPSVAAQVMRYARSSYFGYQGAIESIETAITRVLGFDIVANLALGIAAGKAFKLVADGPLGRDNFWRDAVFTATLCQSIARQLKTPGLTPGSAYLCGLLHNFGVLLLGHLFQPEYYLLNRLAGNFPDCSLAVIEQRMLTQSAGTPENQLLSHTHLGGWLMRYWKMPNSVAVVNECHHQHDYQGEEQDYVWLCQLAMALLAEHDIGDGGRHLDVASLQANVGIADEQTARVVEKMLASADELERMAALMTET